MDLYTSLAVGFGSALIFGAVALGVQRIGPVWDAAAASQMGKLTGRFERLGLDVAGMKFWLRMWGLGVCGVFLFVWLVLGMFPVACLLTLLVYIAPRHVLDFLIRRRSKILRDQMVSATQGLANAVKAGLSLAQGLETVAAEAPFPLASELRRIVFEFQRGRPLKEAIEQVRCRLDLEPFTLFALSVEAAIDRGGRINEALERISHSLQENQRLERKLEADTSSGRQVVLILAVFPFFFLGMFFVLDSPGVSLLFSTLIGQLVLVAVVLLVYIGVRWATRILQMEV